MPFDSTTKPSTTTTPNPVLQHYLEGQGCQGLEDEDQFLACQNQSEVRKHVLQRGEVTFFCVKGIPNGGWWAG